MNLLENQFYLLSATTRDNRKKIYELADEKSFEMDEGLCNKIKSDLTHPANRITSEISWLIGVRPSKIADLLQTVKNNPKEILDVEGLPALAELNLSACVFPLVAEDLPESVLIKQVERIALLFDGLNVDSLKRMINEERQVSGFPEVQDNLIIETELKKLRQHLKAILLGVLGKFEFSDYVKKVTVISEEITDYGECSAPILVHDLIDSYEINTRSYLEEEEEKIFSFIEDCKRRADNGAEGDRVSKDIQNIENLVSSWDLVAQPIQISAKSRGTSHEPSEKLGYAIRDLAVHLCNEHGYIEESKSLITTLEEVFAELPSLAEKLEDDSIQLDELEESRQVQAQQVLDDAENFRNEVTYEAEIGIVFKDKLRISPGGVEWKGNVFPLQKIKYLAWGGISQSINGIPTGTEYSICIGDGNNATTIQTKRKEVYSSTVDCLWTGVGIRLLTEMIEKIRDGKKLRFGSAIIDDNGVDFERKKFLRSNERIYAPWSKIIKWDAEGTFNMAIKENQKANVSLSYIDDSNTHILATAANLYWKKGGAKLSSIMK